MAGRLNGAEPHYEHVEMDGGSSVDDCDGEDPEKELNIELQPTSSTLSCGSSTSSSSLHEEGDHATENIDIEAACATTDPAASPSQQTGQSKRLSAKLLSKLAFLRKPQEICSKRKFIALLLGTLPVILCALEMIPERCQLCRESTEFDAYIFTAAICGGAGAVLYGTSLVDYWLPRLAGGSFAALGSLFTIWMLLTDFPSDLAFLFVFVGILGAMPGVLTYYILKIIGDECLSGGDDDEDYYGELMPLTKIRFVPAD